MIATLMGIVILWMLACAVCGYWGRFILFLGIAIGGIALNITWMVVGLEAYPFTNHALRAHFAAVVYAVSSFVSGWVLRRLVLAFRG